MTKLVMLDCRMKTKSFKNLEEYFIGEIKNILMTIPQAVANGYDDIGVEEAKVYNYRDQTNVRGKIIRYSPHFTPSN